MSYPPSRTVVVQSIGPQVLQWAVAEPDDYLDYYLDVTAPLANLPTSDLIANVTASALPSGAGELTIQSVNQISNSVVQAWLQGGVPGRLYTIKLDIATFYGRQLSYQVLLPIDPLPYLPPVPVAPSPGFGTPITSNAMALETGAGVGFWALESGAGIWTWG